MMGPLLPNYKGMFHSLAKLLFLEHILLVNIEKKNAFGDNVRMQFKIAKYGYV